MATVLVVDDDPVILKLLEVNFQMDGFDVVCARDGEEALAVARSRQPDVIVTDVMMPKVSGLDLLAAIREDPATKGIPVLLLSARAQATDVREGLEAGADDYVTKPFEPLDLAERVARLVEGRDR
jgi:DNA-binding response OmpR family regulator